ncbi:D-glycero-beta-D-manno-heptose-1,7-bisphosphate 7-phosphatase [Tamilnaduibacter salinus]|uniref:D,D-heptose 1,7-bisphosphate phosphatase n=1 Tax=Tamilnaduibacter salinus TaxID=1484056 RepID=A0A2A2I576_9GAMM|nr:D-glycero-beta-D-manno-heptose 1,7-bisphosphate 7-phosphatase [Tamilnaduibacter salinus]PAV26889.1 D-glycero-beta-D-manno-heptose-1,7-bisphosphate 7-phosphatase [Tamilnaduibacter salinus]
MLVILDRDGVINRYEGEYICSPDDWDPLPGSIEAIARLCGAGHRIAVATNQSGIARGLYNDATLAAMHDRLCKLVNEAGGRIDAIQYCPHHPDDGCDCRKPATGLLRAIQLELGLDSLSNAIMVGDSDKDLEAGFRAGCGTLGLVRTGNGLNTERHLSASQSPYDDRLIVADDLSALVDRILKRP